MKIFFKNEPNEKVKSLVSKFSDKEINHLLKFHEVEELEACFMFAACGQAANNDILDAYGGKMFEKVYLSSKCKYLIKMLKREARLRDV